MPFRVRKNTTGLCVLYVAANLLQSPIPMFEYICVFGSCAALLFHTAAGFRLLQCTMQIILRTCLRYTIIMI